ncbi:FecR family protein [Dyadobacter arcticus]|uniref:Ferric-dicitrate binding protein FerR (Iron transport regulator) n=1 Tax=Dyadobacter arcticus TaxID=1078754 RepID=A0ABX0UM42_9BACT|nr:FecR family protein [Dyadobacter arcticus]NIJ54078.1 ferric-dicitrate binding protein FerR (iron transport regulator) [Dyadobacter arcticus]
MTNYRTHSVEELATDDMFRRWVMDPTPEISNFWKQWNKENPDRSGTVGQARELVLAVKDIYADELCEEKLQFEIDEITRLAEKHKQSTQPKVFYWSALWKSAAVVLMVSGLALLYFTSRSPEKPSELAVQTTDQPLSMQVRINNSKKEMTVLLSDNSVATLSSGSRITYPKTFDSRERRVYLTGEAFFDVTKNSKQPFLVYTNETVTKVLGTSFRVKAFDGDNTVLVVVKTGRVSVYPKKEYETALDPAGLTAGVVLNPNQQAVFLRNENRLEKGVVSQPELLSESVVQKDQIFDDKPVTEVFQDLEKVYGIVIVFNSEILANCAINAQFNDENLRQRMNAICQAIGASYDMVDGQIVINSKGCI